MARHDSFHSRLVAALKVVLPIAALLILSTLFLLSRSTDVGNAIPYAEIDVEEAARSSSVTEPSFAGASEAGDLIAVTAAVARPLPDGTVEAETVRGQMDYTSGQTVVVTAPGALVDQSEDRLRLTGGVDISSSTGYDLRTEALTSGLTRIEAESDGPVDGTGPAGQLSAGKLRISPEGDAQTPHFLFTDRVRLVYQPQGVSPSSSD